LAIGLAEVQKFLPLSDTVIFIINDKEHEDVSRQLVMACRQLSVKHFILPKFSGGEVKALFGVKRLTCFGLKLGDGLNEALT